ncbi:amylo-alpha-1,6-glucosidase [Pseudoxanthomonas indica]|uniref:amylo-alpha-1,6-glucosidase n=1 Tax=Pseudoxanthomonas indica TaxID=428993 RepID=UPI0009A8F8F3|nr:hypothetical protein [Pseudoxanthomonas indica]GGD37420.1 hypothetical protein GCM10007235_06970 [Pseudoxanthomonas indica]
MHGLRAFAGGYSEDGLEIWTFPLQIASHYQLEFVVPGQATVAGIDVLQSVEVDALTLSRRYQAPDFRVREFIYTHASHPGVRVRYEVEGRRDVQVRARFRPSLNLMWPAGVGGQEFGWDDAAKGLVLKEPSHRFEALVSSPQATDHSQPSNDRRGSEFGQPIFLQMQPQPCGRARCASLTFAGQSEAKETTTATTAALAQVQAPTAADYARFHDATRMRLTTPDADANRALLWAQLALEQAWTCNARLGCGLVAGYGPSHGSRRPQYAWYFAGDGLIGTRALVHSGQYARAAEELAFILKYQAPDNGMIWHEMSQSAGFLDWTGDYHYMYVHVDIAFGFLATLAEYDRATGDRAFLQKHWPAVRKVYDYCLSTLDPGDGLPRVPHDKMSANEQDKLSDELTLSASWVEAAQAMSRLAADMGDATLSAQAAKASERARISVRQRYRDVAQRRWISGFTHAGKPGESTSPADLAAIGSGAGTPEEDRALLQTLAAPAYLTAWGLRSKPDTAADYDPQAYSRGSVWGLGSASAAETMWKHGQGEQAADLWRRLVPWASYDSLGHMHEVMRGDRLEAQSESVPEQMWSSAAFLSAAISGLYGLEVDAATPSLSFHPQPPVDWNALKAENIRVGQSNVTLSWQRDASGERVEVDNDGPAFTLIWTTGQGEQKQVLERGRSTLRAGLR